MTKFLGSNDWLLLAHEDACPVLYREMVGAAEDKI
jgi:hypothetical protein